MVEFNQEKKRQNGIFYTPLDLAKHLVIHMEEGRRPSSILDPACGNGSLLSAAKAVFSNDGAGNKTDFFGCDLAPDVNALRQIPVKHIWEGDFLKLRIKQQFDLVLMNPPFVRHHSIPPELKISYNVSVQNICPLPKIADLWAYFLVKSVETVSAGGMLAAILPWSFLQAEYAKGLRAWLADKFATIDVMSISTRQFEDAEERIVLVWLQDKGRPAQSITLRNASDLTENSPHHHLSWAEWVRSRVIASNKGSIDNLLSSFLSRGFIPFRNIADVRIGVVTGADPFFIADRQFAVDLGLSSQDYCLILKTLRNLGGLHVNGKSADKVLMYFPSEPKSFKLEKYLQDGKQQGINLRAHCLRRKPWYTIPKVSPPDAFFPYRTSHTPYVVLNPLGHLCTNSVHSIKWRNLDHNQIRWVQISMLSAIGQLSLEANAKVYGSGVLKIEPNALGSALVTTGVGTLPEESYRRIHELLEANDKNGASELATDVIRKCYGIESTALKTCILMLTELRERRLSF